MQAVLLTHESSVDKVYEAAGSCDDEICTLADFTSLVARRHAAVDDHRTDDGVVRELASLVVNLSNQFARRPNHDGLWFLKSRERAAFDAVAQHLSQYW